AIPVLDRQSRAGAHRKTVSSVVLDWPLLLRQSYPHLQQRVEHVSIEETSNAADALQATASVSVPSKEVVEEGADRDTNECYRDFSHSWGGSQMSWRAARANPSRPSSAACGGLLPGRVAKGSALPVARRLRASQSCDSGSTDSTGRGLIARNA